MGRRVLVTGLGSFWGGRVAKQLEADPDVEVIVGLDTREPQVELERTEYVRSDENYSILSRIVQATQVDTIIHTFLVVDSTMMSSRAMHEINVIGTMNIPVGIATNMRVDGRDRLIPMATEESSVVAAVCNAARQCYDAGGFVTSMSGTQMIAQIQLTHVSDVQAARLAANMQDGHVPVELGRQLV